MNFAAKNLFLFVIALTQACLVVVDADLIVDVLEEPSHPGYSRWVFCGCATATQEGIIGGARGIAPYKWVLGEEDLVNLGEDHNEIPKRGEGSLCSSEFQRTYAIGKLHLGFDEIEGYGTFAVTTDAFGHVPVLPGNEICWSGDMVFAIHAEDIPSREGLNALSGLKLNMYSNGEEHCTDAVRSTCRRF